MNAPDSSWHRIDQHLPALVSRYYRLLLLVGPPRSGKTTALRRLAEERGCTLVNVNLRLSERLLEFTSQRRPHEVQRLLDEVVGKQRSGTLLLDNAEMLFNPALQLDPLRLLQLLSRNRSVVTSWAGSYDGERLTYAVPGHEEFKRYLTPDAVIVSTECVQLGGQVPATPATIMESV